MEEEYNEQDLEERLYAMLHHVDETQVNVVNNKDEAQIVDSMPRSTIRRYWRTSTDYENPYQKVNTSKDNTPVVNKPTTMNNTKAPSQQNIKIDKKSVTPSPTPVDLSIFQSSMPQTMVKTVVVLENDEEHIVELQSSDEDEVIEVALPPKPTIMIESSDDEETQIVQNNSPVKSKTNLNTGILNGNSREVSASPVPSVVSSVSDEFIRGDCIALNISSRQPDNHSFDFSLHGSDLLGQSTPTAKKRKKKQKDGDVSKTSTETEQSKTTKSVDACFATPKSKAKNKKKSKSFLVSDVSIPSADVYDSDSNQSTDIHKNHSYSVTDKSLPSADVYESDSSETVKDSNKQSLSKESTDVDSSDSSVTPKKPKEQKSNRKSSVSITENTPKSVKRHENIFQNDKPVVVDLTAEYTIDKSHIEENIVIGNVSGFTESDDYNDEVMNNENNGEPPKFGSTKVPAILFEDLDFDFLKGKETLSKRKYSLSTLRAEMKKFYNESWGGENFNHREIQKNMSRDKNLWMIDPKDKLPTPSKRKVTCNYCNRPGHRDDTCRMKPPICYMCGSVGHYETRCPTKICVNCGSPNFMYSTMCRNCSSWSRVKCLVCSQLGHPSSHCPDLWRRYHNTIDENAPLEESNQLKKNNQLFCSGCTRRGHLVHNCRVTVPFSGLPINSPYVSVYYPVYPKTNLSHDQNCYNLFRNITQDSTNNVPDQRNKRQSKSPMHETHVTKKRISISDITKTPSANKTQKNDKVETDQTNESSNTDTQKALEFIPLTTNHDRQGQIIQDNEVSDTSDVVTVARIYVTKDIIEKFKTDVGKEWLQNTVRRYNVDVQNSEVNSFLSIKGKVGDQEAFQAELREWTKVHVNENKHSDNDVSFETEHEHGFSNNIPKNRNNVLRKINKALESLKHDLGDPNKLYGELTYLQNQHKHLLNQKVISPKQVSNNRGHINEMLKKLNMVLLGQAGLANGYEHVKELHVLQEKLTNFRQKNISASLRNEIGQHYHCVFTAIPRDDYVELLQKYYTFRQPQKKCKKRKRKEKAPKYNTKSIQKNFTSNPVPKKVCIIINGEGNNGTAKSSVTKANDIEKTKRKLVFYHQRLINARPVDAVLKKTRIELVRRLHTQIASLGNNPNTTSKNLKKMRKLQHQVQLFLTNV